MSELICPNCGKAFTVDESEYANLVRQVRNAEFTREVAAHEKALAAGADAKVAQAVAEARAQMTEAAAAKDAQIAQLTAQLAATRSQAKTDAELAASRTKDQLTAQIDAQAKVIAELRAAQSAAAAQQELAVTQARAKAERERDELKFALEQERNQLAAQLAQRESDITRINAEHTADLAEKLQAKDLIIADKEAEVERVRDMKMRLSTKLLGESLEQHCEIAFNQVRAMAFPNAYFEKDSDTSINGQKGDFIFRETDTGAPDGTEIVSIMFEMKTEADDSTHTHKNEDFFRKLDSDRRAKNCEYAVLVSMLEPESELYNGGIVDVSYRYPKMYVVRPQFFLPIITLLRNAGLRSLEARQELAMVRQQNIDVTNFENKMAKFKEGFFYNCEQASKRHEEAINEIDKAIKALTAVREKLTNSSRQLELAEKKLDDLTIKKLTRGNPTMKAKFAEARDAQDAADAELPAEPVEAELVD